MTQIRDAGIVITGASRGIGEAAAVELAERGARLVLVARTENALERLAERLRSGGTEVHVVTADLSEEAQVRSMVAIASERLGQIDVLINNAGLGLAAKAKDIRSEDLRYVLEVNVMAALVATQAALPAMLARKRGHIVNIGSVASHITPPGLGGYAASKFALKALTDAFRMELRGKGVTFTLVCPGPIKTKFVSAVKGATKGNVPSEPVGVPVEEAGKAIAHAIARGVDEEFVPRYWQAIVGANSMAPQFWRLFGQRTWTGFGKLARRFS